MSGLKVTGIGRSLEAYCDDINVFTDNLADFDVVDKVIVKFEKISGAILSRNKKLDLVTGLLKKTGLLNGLKLSGLRRSLGFSLVIHTMKYWI